MYKQLELFRVVQYATCIDEHDYIMCVDIGYVYTDDDYRDYCFISAQYGFRPLFL